MGSIEEESKARSRSILYYLMIKDAGILNEMIVCWNDDNIEGWGLLKLHRRKKLVSSCTWQILSVIHCPSVKIVGNSKLHREDGSI